MLEDMNFIGADEVGLLVDLYSVPPLFRISVAFRVNVAFKNCLT